MAITKTAPGELDTAVLLRVLTEFKRGNFSVRMPDEWTGSAGKIADTLNEVIEANQRLGKELARVGRVVGEEGRIGQRAAVPSLGGEWTQSVDSVNELIENLVRPTSEMARVIGAVAGGDLSQNVATEIDGRAMKGQFLQTAKTVNTMVHQLNGFAGEVTRVAREVGMEGKLGGQAQVKGVGGVWKDLTDNVNLMAGNLTSQVRNIAEVTTAVANGDLSKKITVDVRGELLELKNTVNVMVDQLNAFAGEVTRVARDVALIALRNARLYAQAAESSRAKGEFLNLAAHELRTPLSVVSGYASMLRDGTFGAPPGPWVQPLEVLTGKLGELNALVDDLLTAARTEAGRNPAARIPVDLCDLARDAVARALPRARLLGGRITINRPRRRVQVMVDPAQSARVLDNLINNALTYSVGAPVVRLQVDPGAAAIRVEDHGPGIPDAHQQHIFDRFVRIDHDAVGPRSGTGLGLYIARALAEQQEGRVVLERSGPGGSVFALTLRPAPAIDVSADLPPAPPPPAPGPGDGVPLEITVVRAEEPRAAV